MVFVIILSGTIMLFGLALLGYSGITPELRGSSNSSLGRGFSRLALPTHVYVYADIYIFIHSHIL